MASVRQIRLFGGSTPIRTFRIDYARAIEVATSMVTGSTQTFVFEGDLGKLEYFVHELGHAMSLGIPIKPRFDREVDHHAAMSDSNEALVLAAESPLFRWLGHPIPKDEIYDVLQIQSVDTRLFDEQVRSFAALRLAHRLLTWLRASKIVS